jgi:hypothetical protein
MRAMFQLCRLGDSVVCRLAGSVMQLLDLAAMPRLLMCMRKWTAGSPAGAPPASGARFSSRHCKGTPATPFPCLQMISTTTSPITFASLRLDTGKIRHKHSIGRPVLSIVRLSIGIRWC